MTALILGFGIQVGLFFHLRLENHRASKTTLAAGTGTSALAMTACCAHHLIDVLPIIGLSAFALILSKYQTYFFLLGILSNIGGISLMLYKIIK